MTIRDSVGVAGKDEGDFDGLNGLNILNDLNRTAD